MIPISTLQKLPLSADECECLHKLNIGDICIDSRHIKQDDLFVLLDGESTQRYGAKFIKEVIGRASAVLTEVDINQWSDEQKLDLPQSLPVIYVPNLRAYLGDFIRTFLQDKQGVPLPSIAAVTGTNGKTTISQLIAQLVHLSGHRSAVMGTAGNGEWGQLEGSTHTTADVLAVHRFAHTMGVKGADVLSLEASSHGLCQHRLQGLPIDVAIFSNLSRDHLDYHNTMAEYGDAKTRLFDGKYFSQLRCGIVNIDDEFGAKLIERLRANKSNLTLWSYSTKTKADFYAKSISPSLDGADIELVTPFGELLVKSPLLGAFNVANLLASAAGFLSLYPKQFANLPNLIAKLNGALGRMQKVDISECEKCVIVDYAHTPDALTQVLTSLKAHCKGRLWAVFGCGGDRDKGKRPLMTKAGLLADKVVLTSDNPRGENPLAILADMQQGLGFDDHYRIHIEPDRRQAIYYALAQMKPEDIVVIAGKGHETYQEIKGERTHFDDMEEIRQFLTP